MKRKHLRLFILATVAIDLHRISNYESYPERAEYDCSDFRLVNLIRILYEYGNEIPDETLEKIEDVLLNFRYWWNESGRRGTDQPDRFCGGRGTGRKEPDRPGPAVLRYGLPELRDHVHFGRLRRMVALKNMWSASGQTPHELEYAGAFKINDRVVDTRYRRYDSPYVTGKKKDPGFTFSYRGDSLFLDFERMIRVF